MKRFLGRGSVWMVLCVIGLAATAAWMCTAAPAQAAKLERLIVAVAPLGWDTNFTWLQSRSGQLDKRPALEYLIGIDRHTGAYIPQLAEKWEMSPDGKNWTVWLRKGVKFHEQWGEFTAKDVRHAVFLITQPESVQTDASIWRNLLGIGKTDAAEEIARKIAQGVEILDDYTVVFRLQQPAPEFVENLSANTDLAMESKARWDTGGRSCMARRWWAPAPSSSSSAKWARTCSTSESKTTGARPRSTKNWSFAGCRRTSPGWPLAERRSTHIRRAPRPAAGGRGQGYADSRQRTARHAAPVAIWWAILCQPGQAGRQCALCAERSAAGHESGH